MLQQVQLGKQYTWNGRVVEADGILSASTVAGRDIVTGERVSIPTSELSSIQSVERSSLDAIPQEAWDRAKKKTLVLMPLIEQHRVTNAQLTRAAQALGKSPRQIQRYLRRLRLKQQISALVDSKKGRRVGTRVLPKEAERVVSHCLVKYYLVPQRCSAAFVAERVEAMCRRIGVKPPARSTLYRRIDRLDRAELLAARGGKRAARERYKPQTGTFEAKAPLEIVQIDHTKVDLLVVSDDDDRHVLGRPFLTVAIDVYSRCIVGFVISLDAPSALAVALCISHMVLPKEPWLRELGIDVPYPMYGRPLRIGTDNAQEFRGMAMARGCDEMGIILEHRPVGLPNWGGHVERLVGTLMRRVHCLPGTTFSNTHDKGKAYDSEAKASMTLREFRRWFIYEVATRYHQTVHRTLGRTPAAAWEEGIRTKGSGVQEVVSNPLDLLAWFLPAEPRKVRRDGIEIFGNRYWHPDLEDLIHKDEKALVHYDTRDVSKVYVRGADGHMRCAEAVTPGVKPISLFEHQESQRMRRLASKDPAALALLDAGIDANDNLVKKSKALTRSARLRTARESERRRSNTTPTAPQAPVDAAVPEAESFTPWREPRQLPVEHWQ